MRIVIIGQKWLAAELLHQCVRQGHRVLAVSAPEDDKLAHSAQQYAVPNLALANLPECDIILCAHAHVFIPATVRDKAQYGAYGYHPSLLPRHRGRDAIRWAIHMREPVTGGTVYHMDDGADTGDIAVQDWCHIAPGDTAAELWRRELAPMGLRLFGYLLDGIKHGSLRLTPQRPELATWEPAFSTKALRKVKLSPV